MSTAPEDTILDEAKGLIYGQREKDYGGALESFTKIAAGWSIILDQGVSPEQVTLCMDWLKTCRLLNEPKHHDSIVDKAGYSGCYEKILVDRVKLDSEIMDCPF